MKESIDLWGKIDFFMLKRCLPIRIIYDSLRIFLLEHCTIRATALAYTSLLAVIPLIVLLTSISLSLGVGDLFINHLPTLLPKMLESIMPYVDWVLHLFLPGSYIELNAITNIILDNIMPFLIKAQEINLGSLGLVGGVGLLVTFILAIDTIETNMNIVWDVHETRGYGQKIAIFVPFLLLFAGGIGVFSMFLRSMHDILEKILVQRLPFGKFGELLVNLSIPVALLIMLLFALWLLYCYMPYVPGKSGFWYSAVEKTRKRGFPAVIAACFTFVAVAIFSAVMIFVQASMFARWSLLYGSLAFFPMLMFLLFGIWCVILYGNALCWRISERTQPRGYFYHRILKLTDRWKLKKDAYHARTLNE